jgi:excisionase family DNA binding protein
MIWNATRIGGQNVILVTDETTYSTQQAADILGIHKSTLHRWIEEKRIRTLQKTSYGMKRQPAFRIPQSEIDRIKLESQINEQAD